MNLKRRLTIAVILLAWVASLSRIRVISSNPISRSLFSTALASSTANSRGGHFS